MLSFWTRCSCSFTIPIGEKCFWILNNIPKHIIALLHSHTFIFKNLVLKPCLCDFTWRLNCPSQECWLFVHVTACTVISVANITNFKNIFPNTFWFTILGGLYQVQVLICFIWTFAVKNSVTSLNTFSLHTEQTRYFWQNNK
jgi:hypothetical protein